MFGRGRKKYLVVYKSLLRKPDGTHLTTDGNCDAFTDRLTYEVIEQWQTAIAEKYQPGESVVIVNVIQLEG